MLSYSSLPIPVSLSIRNDTVRGPTIYRAEAHKRRMTARQTGIFFNTELLTALIYAALIVDLPRSPPTSTASLSDSPDLPHKRLFVLP